MLPRTATILLLGASACAGAESAAPAAQGGCDLTIRFGSYAMGIDTSAAAAVDRILERRAREMSVTRHGGGREGEYGLCIGTASPAAAARLFDEIRAVLPAKPRGPISIKAGERRFSTPPRR
jgi:hypothetical protein